MGLCSQKHRSQFSALHWVNPHLFKDLDEVKGKARHDMDHGRTKINHQLDLPFAIARAGRNGQATNFLSAVMKTQSSCKQAVAPTVLEDVRTPDTDTIKATGYQIAPCLNVVLRMENGRDSSCCPGGRMATETFFKRNHKS